MPILPDFTAVDRAQAQPSGGVAGYRPNQGPDVGAGVQAGRDMQQAAEILAESNARQDAMLAQSKANDLANIGLKLENDPKGGLRSVQGAGVVGKQFVDTYTQKFKDAAQAVRDTLQTDQQKAMFDRHVEVQSLRYQSSLLQHQAQQTKVFNDKTDNDTVRLAIDAIARDPTNVLTYGSKVAEIETTLKGYAQRNGLSPESTQELLNTTRSAAVIARITSLAHGIPGVSEPDPDTAMALFKMEQPNLTAQANESLSKELLQAGVADKAQKIGAQVAAQFDYLHTGDAQKFIDGMDAPAPLKKAIRDEVEHRHAVQQSDADKTNAVLMGKLDTMVQSGASLAAITKSPEFAQVRDQGRVLALIRERTEHQVNLQNAIESRDFTRVQRLRAEEEYNGIKKMMPYSDPMVLAGMSREQVAGLTLELGPHNTQRLLERYDSFKASADKLREAKIDSDQFNVIADSLGLKPFAKGASEDDKRMLAVAKDRTEAAIAVWQQAHPKEAMPREEKAKVMRSMLAEQVTTRGMFGATWGPFGSNTNVLQVPEKDIVDIVVPDTDAAQITDALRRASGKPDYKPSPAELGRMYLLRKSRDAALRQ